MAEEWEKHWNSVKTQYPIPIHEWAILRERHFLIWGTTDPEEIRIASLFKRQFIQNTPGYDRYANPLILRLQMENQENGAGIMTSGKFLDELNAIEHNRQYDQKAKAGKPISAKSMATKRKSDVSEKWCDFHKSTTHSNDECRSKRGKEDLSFNSKKPLSTPFQPKNGKVGGPVKGKPSSKPISKSMKIGVSTEKFSKLNEKSSKAKPTDEIKALRAEIAELKASFNGAKILQAKFGEHFIHYLDHISDQSFLHTNTIIYLDSGASHHLAPLQLDIQCARRVSDPLRMIDASNNSTPIQFEGDMELDVAGEWKNFENVLLSESSKDILISCSQILKDTDDRIELTATNAYYRKAGSNERHEIALLI
jgi:hypothetical protein